MPDIFTSVITDSFTINTYILCTAVALVCGILTAVAANFRNRTTKSFAVALILLPVIVETVIIMVNGNIGTGVAVAGAFSLIRFRSAPGSARDISALFLVMTAGLACATGYVGVAVVLTLIICIAMIILSFVKIGSEKEMDLRITVPEDLSFNDDFDDLFEKYTTKAEQKTVKTSNMGSLYKLKYKVTMKDSSQLKSFIDELRCRNGNLEISICSASERDEEAL